MTEPSPPNAATDSLKALAMVRGILDGEPGPFEVPASAFRGLAIQFITFLKVHASTVLGITDPAEQDAFVRGILKKAEDGITVVAFRHELGGTDE